MTLTEAQAAAKALTAYLYSLAVSAEAQGFNRAEVSRPGELIRACDYLSNAMIISGNASAAITAVLHYELARQKLTHLTDVIRAELAPDYEGTPAQGIAAAAETADELRQTLANAQRLRGDAENAYNRLDHDRLTLEAAEGHAEAAWAYAEADIRAQLSLRLLEAARAYAEGMTDANAAVDEALTTEWRYNHLISLSVNARALPYDEALAAYEADVRERVTRRATGEPSPLPLAPYQAVRV